MNKLFYTKKKMGSRQQVSPISLCTVAMVTSLGISTVFATEQNQSFNIPRQSLSSALNSYAEIANISLSYSAELATGIQSQGVKGKFTADQALQKLLAGTGVIARTTANGTITLEKAAKLANEKNPATSLPPVKVIGNSIYDVKNPYNEDYVLPDATAGTKIDTPIMETPLNVQVISKQVLKDQQVINLGEALKNVSGVTTSSASGNEAAYGGTSQSITLRGFSSNIYMRNGFRLQDGSATREMANVENVEVLKGSAAILYGQVEPGGMVNVITKQPLATPYYAAQQQFGSFNTYRTTIDATGPVADNKDLLYRMNMSYENRGSYRDYVQNEKFFVAPIVKWNINPRNQMTFELEYTHDNLGLDTPYIPTYNGQFVKIPRNWNYDTPTNSPQDNILGAMNWSHQFNDDWSLKHNFIINQLNANRLFLVPYSPLYSATPDTIDRNLYQRDTKDTTYSTSLDLNGHFATFGIKHNILLGGDYYHYKQTLISRIDNFNDYLNNDTFNYIFNPVQAGLRWNGSGFTQIPAGTPNAGMSLYSGVIGSNFNNSQQTDQYGLYLQDQIKLPYNIHVLSGFRYQNIHQSTDYLAVGSSNSNNGLTQEAITPRVGLLWQPQNQLSLYSNYTENFGANNGWTYPNHTPVPATGANQWEVGAKTEFFEGRLRATLAYYDLTKTNIAVSDPNPQHTGASLVIGAIHSSGPELDIQGEIMPGWNVIASYSNTDITVTKGTGNPQYDYPAVGSRFWGVPRNTGSLWNTYEFQQDTLKNFKIGAGVTLRDGQLTNTYSNPTPGNSAPGLASIPGYGTVDLLAAYSLKLGKSKVTAQLNVNNLFDKYYITSAAFAQYPASSGYDAAYVNFGTPRTLMGSIRIEY